MVTGIECAGLILSVLPLFVEAGNAYSDGVESILNVSLQSRRDAELSDCYDNSTGPLDSSHSTSKPLPTPYPTRLEPENLFQPCICATGAVIRWWRPS